MVARGMGLSNQLQNERATNDRLRAALHKIASAYPCQDTIAMMRVAREALGISVEQSAKPGEGQ